MALGKEQMKLLHRDLVRADTHVGKMGLPEGDGRLVHCTQPRQADQHQ
ncbi:MAG: hypothetical protein OEW92_05425 [Gammaproteobacteria bacterium]|nr:hypothetical protein [Gammaproteobacteria bacterium]MDH5171838.1 hypothetical protein [Gammaproteobacteria bacterium]